MERQYRNHLSGYLHWDQLIHAEDWLLFEKNIGAYICIDEVALSRGELYTVLINKEAHGGKGSIIAIIKGTDVHTVTSVLLKLSRLRRYQVREITLDMAPNMEQIARICFPAAKRVTDRFSYIDLLNYMLKYKIPQIVTLTHFFLSLMGIKKMRIKRFIKPFILIVVAEIRLERMTFGL